MNWYKINFDSIHEFSSKAEEIRKIFKSLEASIQYPPEIHMYVSSIKTSQNLDVDIEDNTIYFQIQQESLVVKTIKLYGATECIEPNPNTHTYFYSNNSNRLLIDQEPVEQELDFAIKNQKDQIKNICGIIGSIAAIVVLLFNLSDINSWQFWVYFVIAFIVGAIPGIFIYYIVYPFVNKRGIFGDSPFVVLVVWVIIWIIQAVVVFKGGFIIYKFLVR